MPCPRSKVRFPGSHQSDPYFGWSGKPQRSEIELDAPFPYVRRIHAMVDDITRREGIPLLDLSPSFHQHAPGNGSFTPSTRIGSRLDTAWPQLHC